MGLWFSLPEMPRRRAFVSAVAIMALAARPVSAQAPTGPTGSSDRAQELQSLDMTCWQGAPLPACGGFFVVEMQGVMPLVQSQRRLGDRSFQTFESQLEWNLGYMGNVGSLWAVGATVSIGSGAQGTLRGLRARARRWLGPQRSLELEGGMFRTHAFSQPGDLTGVTAGVRFNLGDRGSLFVRWDGVDVPAFSFDGTRPPSEGGGFKQALHVGVGTGSTWALATTGALALGSMILFAILDSGGQWD